MTLAIGLTGRSETLVTPENTAAAVGSGLAPVFATPAMIALMENAAVAALSGALAQGEGTVGVHLDVSHESATPVGMQVWAEAELIAVEGKKLTFAVRAFDAAGRIGSGTHQRCIVSSERFLARAREKMG